MSNADLNMTEAKVTPATEAKEFPLAWIRLLSLTGGPNGMRAYAELAPYRRLADGTGEVKTPEVQGDIVEVEVPDILAMASTGGNPELVENTILAFLQAGGNLPELAMAAVTLCVKSIGIQQGKLAAGA